LSIPVTTTATRNKLRRELRARRQELTAPEQTHAAHLLSAQLVATRQVRVSRRIAVYLPNDGEIDPVPFMARLWKMKKTCYLPILSRLRHDRLWFAPFTQDTPLAPNRFGILEPVVPARAWVRAPELDLILMPLVAFDPHGNRLGMGGGFYDKSLAFLRQRSRWHKPHLIGLAHDFQRVKKLEACAWDVPLQGVVTDHATYSFT
jgi:5-formyltetrahydrofolate cyclo-ligase